MPEVEASGALIRLVVQPPNPGKMGLRRISILVTRVEIKELAACLDCCPGSKTSTPHAVWHFNHPQQARPCPTPEMWQWY